MEKPNIINKIDISSLIPNDKECLVIHLFHHENHGLYIRLVLRDFAINTQTGDIKQNTNTKIIHLDPTTSFDNNRIITHRFVQYYIDELMDITILSSILENFLDNKIIINISSFHNYFFIRTLNEDLYIYENNGICKHIFNLEGYHNINVCVNSKGHMYVSNRITRSSFLAMDIFVLGETTPIFSKIFEDITQNSGSILFSIDYQDRVIVVYVKLNQMDIFVYSSDMQDVLYHKLLDSKEIDIDISLQEVNIKTMMCVTNNEFIIISNVKSKKLITIDYGEINKKID